MRCEYNAKQSEQCDGRFLATLDLIPTIMLLQAKPIMADIMPLVHRGKVEITDTCEYLRVAVKCLAMIPYVTTSQPA